MPTRNGRPDPTVRVLDCWPMGLGLLQGLGPAKDSLTRSYDAILAAWLVVALDAPWLGHPATWFSLIAPTPAGLTGQV